jgi:hypothetical protein
MGFMRICLGAVVAALLFCVSNTGSAFAATFNLGGNGGLDGSYVFNEDGITLTVAPAAITLGATPAQDTVATQGQVGQYSGGLGISQNSNESHQVDGYGVNELLVLAFSETVRIVSAEFRYVSSNDDFEFWHDDERNGSLDGDYVFTADIPGSLVYVFAGNYVSDLFGIGATHKSDDFKLYALTISPVPLPAALPMFASAFGAFGAVRLRKRRNAGG